MMIKTGRHRHLEGGSVVFTRLGKWWTPFRWNPMKLTEMIGSAWNGVKSHSKQILFGGALTAMSLMPSFSQDYVGDAKNLSDIGTQETKIGLYMPDQAGTITLEGYNKYGALAEIQDITFTANESKLERLRNYFTAFAPIIRVKASSDQDFSMYVIKQDVNHKTMGDIPVRILDLGQSYELVSRMNPSMTANNGWPLCCVRSKERFYFY